MKTNKPQKFYLKTKSTYYQNNIKVDFNNIDPNKYWVRYVTDRNGHIIRFQSQLGYLETFTRNDSHEVLYFENSNGYWKKWKYDIDGNVNYSIDSDGYIEDDR